MTDSKETIEQIQKTFQDILQLDPLQVDKNYHEFFHSLENDLRDIKYRTLLSTNVPYTAYPQLVKLFKETKDETINKVISEIITCLSSDKSEALQELMKYDILNIILQQMNSLHFPNSMFYHLQTIANFISDSNTEISQTAHQVFSLEYIIKTYQLLEKLFAEKNDLISEIFKKWLKCIYISLERYSVDSDTQKTTIILNEIVSREKIIKEDPDTCRLFCYILLIMIDSKIIDYNNFNSNNYPSFLDVLSKNDSEQIKAYVFPVIGKLILTNHYPVDCNFMEFLNIILNSNKDNSDDLLEAVLFVCSCFFENKKISENAFHDLSTKLDDLFQFYIKSNSSTKGKVINLFSSYLNYISQLKYDVIPQLGPKIQTITNYMFDFIGSHDRLDKIIRTLYILSEFITYISSVCDTKSECIVKFIQDCNQCMENLLKSNDKTIKEIAEQQLVILKKFQ